MFFQEYLALFVLLSLEMPPMLVVPGGSFIMGSTNGYADERPLRVVNVSAFEISRSEVTVAQYGAYEAVPARASPNGRQPVTFVSRDDASRYAFSLSQATGRSCRLPSEAEWEYAARMLSEQESVNKNGLLPAEPTFVSSTGPSPVPIDIDDRVYGILGNVAEWVQDCYHSNYSGAPLDGSARLDCEHDLAVVRGGSWADPPHRRTATARNDFSSDERSDRIGFRILCELDD